jgi:hypothetical protein
MLMLLETKTTEQTARGNFPNFFLISGGAAGNTPKKIHLGRYKHHRLASYPVPTE